MSLWNFDLSVLRNILLNLYDTQIEIPRGSYTKTEFMSASDADKELMVKELSDSFISYRDKGGSLWGPFSLDKSRQTMISIKESASSMTITDGCVERASYIGNDVCAWLNPLVWKASVSGKVSMWDRWQSNEYIYKAVKNGSVYVSDYQEFSLSNLRDWLIQTYGQAPTNFKPVLAAFLYMRYSPVGGTVYDYSAGFGGRLMGAIAAGRKYIGVDPSTETIERNEILGKVSCMVSNKVQSKYVKLHCMGSEDYIEGIDDTVDFAFSSPPYFNLERYSEDESQCYIKYPAVDSWLEFYATPTIQNCWKYLKPGGYYGVNIADYKKVRYVQRWLDIVTSCGFVPVETLSFDLQNRRGTGHKENIREKMEGIYIFQKPSNESCPIEPDVDEEFMQF